MDASRENSVHSKASKAYTVKTVLAQAFELSVPLDVWYTLFKPVSWLRTTLHSSLSRSLIFPVITVTN